MLQLRTLGSKFAEHVMAHEVSGFESTDSEDSDSESNSRSDSDSSLEGTDATECHLVECVASHTQLNSNN